MNEGREIRYLGELQRLELGRNDVLVLTVPGVISSETAKRMREQLESRLPEVRGVIVLSEGMTLAALDVGKFK